MVRSRYVCACEGVWESFEDLDVAPTGLAAESIGPTHVLLRQNAVELNGQAWSSSTTGPETRTIELSGSDPRTIWYVAFGADSPRRQY